MIKGIGFDLQFTIVYLEHFTLEKWFHLFDAGFAKVIAYLNDLNINFEEKKLKRVLRRIRNKYFALTITEDQQYFTEEILKDTFSKMDITLNPDQFIKCIQIYHSIEIPAWKPFPNAQKTLKTLSANYQLALITNASEYVTHEILRLQNMVECFRFIFTKARKPRFPSFKKFQQVLNVPFNEIVMVGDDLAADIVPALKLGMKTIHTYRGYEYLHHHSALNVSPDKRIDAFEDVITAIEELKYV
ncbi:MAG TPA: HAD family hydrolase [Candidatus Deferrimicrobium sp.]|nr:HAD family hydrolase [Candidatus Deferrimicrobium sp.]